jgi:hypothetical protein
MNRILVAASLDGHATLRGLMRDMDADFVTSVAGGVEALMHRQYAQIVVDLQFAHSRALEFARYAKEEQPQAHVVCVNLAGWGGEERRRRDADRRQQHRILAARDRRRYSLNPLRPGT